MTIPHRNALVVGGSSGVGRAVALRLASECVETTAVARTPERLAALQAAEPNIRTESVDAAADGAARDLIARLHPDLIVLAGGARPHMAPLSDQTWEAFSAVWQTDTKIAFEFAQAVLTADLPGATSLVTFASGAAINGSPQSGGYAGAKRMQHLITDYARVEAAARELDLTFHTIYPKQLIAGTEIAREAASVYGPVAGRTPEQFMDQWEAPLTPEKIADDLVALLGGAEAHPGGTWTVTGTEMAAMPS